jgi:hypothetical protein
MIIMIVKILVLRVNLEMKQQVYVKIVILSVLGVFLRVVPKTVLLVIQQHFYTVLCVILIVNK